MGFDKLTAAMLTRTSFLQTRFTRFVSKGLKIAPLLNRDQTDADLYEYFVEEKTAEEAVQDGDIKRMRQLADGSELDIIRDTDIQGKTKRVTTRGFKYAVTPAKLKRNPYSILRIMQRHSYVAGREVELDVVNTLMSGAGAPTIDLNDGGWATSNKIDLDLEDMQEAFYDDSLPNVLNQFCYNKTNLKQVKRMKRALEGTGGDTEFRDNLSMDWMGANHAYGGFQQTLNKVIGFDKEVPPGTVAWGTEEGAFNPDVLQGMETYAPFINVMVKEVTDELPKKTIFFMLVRATTVVEERKGLLCQDVSGS